MTQKCIEQYKVSAEFLTLKVNKYDLKLNERVGHNWDLIDPGDIIDSVNNVNHNRDTKPESRDSERKQ